MVGPKLLLAASLGVAQAALLPRAFKVPSGNGFPSPDDQQTLAIEQQAGGKLPNSPPAKSLGAGTTTAFQLIAFNELFETAYFSSLVKNITDGAPGYENPPTGALDTLKVVLAVSKPLLFAGFKQVANVHV